MRYSPVTLPLSACTWLYLISIYKFGSRTHGGSCRLMCFPVFIYYLFIYFVIKWFQRAGTYYVCCSCTFGSGFHLSGCHEQSQIRRLSVVGWNVLYLDNCVVRLFPAVFCLFPTFQYIYALYSFCSKQYCRRIPSLVCQGLKDKSRLSDHYSTCLFNWLRECLLDD